MRKICARTEKYLVEADGTTYTLVGFEIHSSAIYFICANLIINTGKAYLMLCNPYCEPDFV